MKDIFFEIFIRLLIKSSFHGKGKIAIYEFYLNKQHDC